MGFPFYVDKAAAGAARFATDVDALPKRNAWRSWFSILLLEAIAA